MKRGGREGGRGEGGGRNRGEKGRRKKGGRKQLQPSLTVYSQTVSRFVVNITTIDGSFLTTA